MMIYDYPTIVVDNFFKDPNEIRNFALKFKFEPCDVGTFSGIRTESLHITHTNFFKRVCSKILDCYSIPYHNFSASMHFHLTDEKFGDSGWVHTDASNNLPPGLASIIYLNPDNNSIDTGTNLYKLNNLDYGHEDIKDMKLSFIESRDKADIRHKANLNYTPTVKIGNFYNRMIAYDSRTPHAGSSYFGNDRNTSRLTLLTFFHAIQTPDNFTPLRRADARSEI